MTSDPSQRPVSPLRARMIEDMTVHGFNERTRGHDVHVLPKGFHRIRHYGLPASAGCKANIARARELMAAPMPKVEPPAAQDTAGPHASDHRPPCPCCGGRMMNCRGLWAWRCTARPALRRRDQDVIR
jgi:hypothetical protein